MEKGEVQERVIDIVAEQLGVKANEIQVSASYVHDLGADSLDTVELVMALEDEFGVSIPDNVSENIKTIQDTINYIVEQQSQK
jgi:acyl carrier protein